MKWSKFKFIVLAFVVMNMLLMNFAPVADDTTSCSDVTVLNEKYEGSDHIDFIGTGVTRYARIDSEADLKGGSWLDSFEDSTGIDSSGSSNILLKDGNAKISNSDLVEFTTDSETIALWHMDEGTGTSVSDESANSLSGTFKETPEWTSGWFNSALEFSGGDQFYDGDSVVVPHNPVLDLGSVFTIEAWIKVKGTQEYNAIVDKYEFNSTATQEHGYTFEIVDGFLRTSIYYGAAGTFNIAGTSDLRDDHWHHVAVVYDGTDYYEYVDGHLEIKLPSDLTPTTTNNDLGIGLRLSGYGGFMPLNGKIDEVRISSTARFPVDLSANVRSNSIQLPVGMNWDTIIFNASIPADSELNFIVIDSTTGEQVPGTPNILSSGEYDISYIDPTKYTSIKFYADLEGTSWGVTPLIHYWGASWNASFVLRDTIFGGVKLESLNGNNVDVVDGSTVFQSLGTLITTTIELPKRNGFKFYFDSLVINREAESNSNLLVTVTDTQNKPILDFKDLTDKTINLRSIDPEIYPSIKLRLNYISSTTTGILHDWSITLFKNNAPVIQNINPSSASVLRTQVVTINTDLLDPEEFEGDLTLKASYKSPSNDALQANYLTGPLYSGESWEYMFTPPKDAEPGYYTFKFECSDALGDLDSVTRTDFIEVLNNAPIISELVTSTSENNLYRTQNLRITFNAIDTETPVGDLKVMIYHRAPDDQLWRANYFSELTYNDGYFSTLFTPPKDAEGGLYTINLSCDDGKDVVIETFDILVLNNLPTEPSVEIKPVKPKSSENLTATATNSTDIETSAVEMNHWNRWYRNDIYLPEFDNFTSIYSTETEAGERWRCVVFSFDGDGLSTPGEAEVIIEVDPVSDSDGDGVHDDLDAFPEDPAASVDSDGDGYPDLWNPNKSQLDSNTGLSLDKHPKDGTRHSESKDSESGTVLTNSNAITFFILILIILLFSLYISVVYQSRRIRDRNNRLSIDNEKLKDMDSYDRILFGVEKEVLDGKSPGMSELGNKSAQSILNKKYRTGEISDEAYDYIENLISDTEQDYYDFDAEDLSDKKADSGGKKKR